MVGAGEELGGGVFLQHVQRDDFERPLVGGRQSDRSGKAGVDALEPTRGADAPTVAGPETRKIIVWRGVVADLKRIASPTLHRGARPLNFRP